jgi:molecular chaperone DnaK
MGKHIGIDLGTTNSVACFYDGRETRIPLSLFQEEMTPSAVALDRLDEEDLGTIVVGRSAVSQAKLYPRDTIFSIKRLMGRPFKARDVQEWKARANYEIVEDERGRAAVMLGGQRKTPEEISAEILKRIKSDAERELGEPVTHAVITVPAYFGETEQAATRDAGRAAGLVVKQLLPDPTAAAIAFGTEARPDRRLILTYDLGGSTFDISIVLVAQGKEGMPSFTVRAVDGNHFLGGDDFDLVIVRMILDHVKGKHGLDLSADRQFLAVCKPHAEQAKKMLSAEERAYIVVPEAFAKEGKAVHIKMRVERAEFEKQIAPLVEKARGLVLATLKAECLSPDMIDDVLLVGGSTFVPLVEKSVEELFGKEKVRRSVNPTNCVAAGAAILAGQMRGVECPQCKGTHDESADRCTVCGTSLAVPAPQIEGVERTEIASNHFGFAVVKGEDLHAFLPLIKKGTRLPMREPNFHTFFITAANQRRIRIPVFEGLGATVSENTHIGVIEYEPPVELPIDQPVRVGLQLDRQSILKVVIEVEDYNIHHEGELKREAVDVTPPPIHLIS